MQAIREFLLTPTLVIPSNCIARYANFVAQEHHAYHSKSTGVKHTSLYTATSLAAAGGAPAKTPTVEEIRAYTIVKGLKVELQAQKDAEASAKQAAAERAAAAAEGAATAAESATLPISSNGQAILRSEGHQRKDTIGRLRKAKGMSSHLVPIFLARLREVDVHSYTPMTTSVRGSLNAFDRATEQHLDVLLDTHQLKGSEVTERGTGCEDPHLLG